MRNRTNIMFMLTVIITVGLIIPLMGSALSTYVFPETHWHHQPVHSLIEGLGSAAALLLAGLLLILRSLQKANTDNFLIACALISMGLLDGFHASVEPGNTFVWLHSIATLVGGLIFSLAWTRWYGPPHSLCPLWIWGAAGVVIVLGTSSVLLPDYLPRMTNDLGHFTLLARTLNMVGGMLFYIASVHFILRYYREKDFDALPFAALTMLFGSAGLLFELSQLWDMSWWWWHILRLLAYAIAFSYVVNHYLRLEEHQQYMLNYLSKTNDILSHQTEQLKTSKQRFDLAMQGSGDGLWDWKINDTNMYFSPRWKSMLGFDEDEIKGTFLEWQALIHPDDLGKAILTWSKCMEGDTNSYSIKYRMRTKSGDYKWLESRAITIKDNQGNVIRMAGSHTDISAQKQAEEDLHQYQQGLEQLVTQRTKELKEANQQLQELVSVDGLTGVSNRRAFDQAIKREWNRCKRDQTPFSLLMIDVDYFKPYNDEYGHMSGDQALRAIALSLSSNAKRATDTLARYGGEEFAMILPETNEFQLQEIAETICQDVLDLKIPAASTHHLPYVSVSIGAGTHTPQKNDQWHDFIEQVDKALYQAKTSGRNQVSTGVPLESKMQH